MAHIRAFELIPPIHTCLYGQTVAAKIQPDELHAHCRACDKWWHRHNNFWIEGEECCGKFCLTYEDFSSDGMNVVAVFTPSHNKTEEPVFCEAEEGGDQP